MFVAPHRTHYVFALSAQSSVRPVDRAKCDSFALQEYCTDFDEIGVT